MKLITRDTDYALRALRYIAQHKEKLVSVGELVRELKIPRPFLRKLLQRLNRKRILRSYKGQGGGFLLDLAPDKIFLVDLLEIFQGRFKLNECVFKKMSCPNVTSCLLRKEISAIEKYVASRLKSITLKSLL